MSSEMCCCISPGFQLLPRQALVCHSPVSHLSALCRYLWMHYCTASSLEVAADPGFFFLATFFEAQYWNSFSRVCSVKAKGELREIWCPSGCSVWFPIYLLSWLPSLVWEPCVTRSGSARRMTYRISFTYISQALDGKFREKADRYLDSVPDLWEEVSGGSFLQIFSTWEEIDLVLYPVYVFSMNVLSLTKYNHP